MREEIEKWLQDICDHTTLPENVVALNFGLYEAECGYGLYLDGSAEYDWACDVVYESDYLNLCGPELEAMPWKDFLNRVVDILTALLSDMSQNKNSPFYGKIVTTGFEDGELIRIQ